MRADLESKYTPEQLAKGKRFLAAYESTTPEKRREVLKALGVPESDAELWETVDGNFD